MMLVKKLALLVISVPIFLVLSPLHITRAVAQEVQLYTPDSHPFGTSYKDWTASWWRWFLSFTENDVPTVDDTGIKCGAKQSGSVWFLAGTWNGVAKRECTVPGDKAILLPIANTACSTNEVDCKNLTENELRDYVLKGNDGSQMKVTIDGKKINEIQRITTDFFDANYAVDNPVKAKPGPARVVADGFYVFIQPMPIGEHVVSFTLVQPVPPGSTQAPFSMDVTYNLHIQ